MSIPERILTWIARASCRKPWWILAGAAGLTLVSLAILPRARITSDVLSLLPADLEAVRTFREAEGSFEESRLLFVLVQSGRPDRIEELRAFSQAWEAALADSPLVDRVEYRSPAGMERFLAIFSGSFIQYLSREEVSRVIDALSADEIRRRVRASRAVLRTAPASRQRIQHDPLGLWEFALGAASGSRGTFRLDLESGLLVTPDHRNLLFTVVGLKPPADLDYGRELVEAVRSAEARVRLARPDLAGLETRYTGGYLFALGEERTIKRDMAVTIITSLLAVHALFIVAFRRVRAILFVGLPLSLGILWTFALFLLCLGEEMVAGTAAFSAILAGLGIDFAIHYLNRFEAEAGGVPLEEAIQRALVSTGGANLAAALTSAAAFAALLTTRFTGFVQMGFLAGSGILLCLIAMTTVMPALFRIVGGHSRPMTLPSFGLGALGDSVERRPITYLAVCTVATLLAATYGAFRIGNIEFETDARKLRPRGDESIAVQQEIEEVFGGAFTFALVAVSGESEEEVLQKTEAILPGLRSLVREEVIASFSAVSTFLPSRSRQEEARSLLDESLAQDRIPRIRAALREEGFRPEPFQEGLSRLASALGAERLVTRATLEEAGMGPLLERHLRRGGRGSVGVVYLYPKVNLWDGSSRARWITRVEEAIPPDRGKLTGLILLSQELATVIQEDFYRAAAIALGAIATIAFLHFRSFIAAGLALLPVLLGAVWLVSGMALLGIQLNYMNIIIFPMILGLGVDDGIHLVHRFREGPPRAGPLIRGTGRAILLTSMTTLVGFGSLTLASHQGMASIGEISLLGIATCLATSLFVLPPLLLIIATPGPGRRRREGSP